MIPRLAALLTSRGELMRMSLVDGAMLVFFSALMSFAASSDLVSMTIPNRLSVLLVSGFLVFAFAIGLPMETVLWHLGAGLVVLIISFAMFAFGWIGGGDAKLAAATAVWCGFATLFEYSLIASVLGGLLTMALLSAREHHLPLFAQRFGWIVHLHKQTTGIPYGIALAAAGLIIFPETAIWKAAFAAV